MESKIPERYGFYATLVHPDKEDKMLSILITKDLDKLVNNSIYPSIDIKVIEHEYSIMSTHSENSLENFNNKMFSIGEYTKEKDSKFLFIKVGGEPRFIQNKEFYYKQLLEDNYSFFLMIDEEGYTNIMTQKKLLQDFGNVRNKVMYQIYPYPPNNLIDKPHERYTKRENGKENK